MKKSVALLLSASLLAGSIGSAQADWDHRREHYGRPPAYYQQQHHQQHNHHHRNNWVGPAAVLAITGLALGAAAYNNSYTAPAPVYVEAAPAPVYVAAPPPRPRLWYYCGSSGQYYPYTNVCPEGWQAVPAR